METNQIRCPSGLVVNVRAMKLREFKYLSDRKAVTSGSAYDEILAGCVDVVDVGPAYPGGFNWKTTALQGDRFYALLLVRCATHGQGYPFDATCPSCRKRVSWEVDLLDLPVRAYPSTAIEKHAKRERFSTTVDGREVEFTLLAAEDEKRIGKILGDSEDGGDALIAGILYRIRGVQGIDRDDVREWVEGLDVEQLYNFREALDAVSGGVETSIEIECRSCGPFEVEIPFGAPGYLTPKAKNGSRSSRT